MRGWTEDLPDRRARVDTLLDAYGATPQDRAEALRLVADRVRATLTGIERMARSGDPAARKLVADGVPDELRENYIWLTDFEI
jgi:hypothetical protein